jgi:hypothetical protein
MRSIQWITKEHGVPTAYTKFYVECGPHGRRELEPCEHYTTAPRALLQALLDVLDREISRQDKLTCSDETKSHLEQQLELELRRLGDDERWKPHVWLESREVFFTVRPRNE